MNTKHIICSGYDSVTKQLAHKRPTIFHLNSEIFPDGGPKPSSLIEISGAPNSGKSLLLWQLMAHCLPPTYFGGKYCDIIFLNLSHKFDVRHFTKSIKFVLDESGLTQTSDENETVIQNCLDSVITLNYYTNEEFERAFDAVDDLLFQHENVAMLAVDTLCEFYWSAFRTKPQRMIEYYTNLAMRLKRICEKHNICCAYTVDSNFIEPKGRTVMTAIAMPALKVCYRIRLELLPDGSRKLNGKPITIDHHGVHFSAAT